MRSLAAERQALGDASASGDRVDLCIAGGGAPCGTTAALRSFSAFVGLGLGLGVLLLGEGGPLLLELGLARAPSALPPVKAGAISGDAACAVGDRHRGDQVARFLGERRAAWALAFLASAASSSCIALVAALSSSSWKVMSWSNSESTTS